MPTPLSAIDAVSPAFDQTKRQLFQTRRFRFWLRMAVVAMTTGDFTFPGSWNEWGHWLPPMRSRRFILPSPEWPKAVWERMLHFWPLLVVVGVLTVILAAMWIYMACVFRFILFNSVLSGECDMKQGWPMWKPQGLSYLLWKICLWVGTGAVLLALVGVPLAWAAGAGLLRNLHHQMPLLIFGGGILLILVTAFLIFVAVISLLAQDFVVPIMALEKVGVVEGWRRLSPMLKRERKSYAGYVLMKIVLLVGTAIFFGLASLITVLLLMIPLGAIAVGVYVLARAAALPLNYYTFSTGVILAGGAVAVIVYALAIVSTPAMVFFQSYANHFLGSRYPKLGARVFPEPSSAEPQIP
jgi:hypothetical protein